MTTDQGAINIMRHEAQTDQPGQVQSLVGDVLPDDMPCPNCGGTWDFVAVNGNRTVVVCGNCDAVIPEDEYIQANAGLTGRAGTKPETKGQTET